MQGEFKCKLRSLQRGGGRGWMTAPYGISDVSAGCVRSPYTDFNTTVVKASGKLGKIRDGVKDGGHLG